jgi:hypothetical protein
MATVGLALAGCSGSNDPPRTAAPPTAPEAPPAVVKSATESGSSDEFEPLPTISLGGEAKSSGGSAAAQGPSEVITRDAIVEALQPIQTLLGNWRGTTRREIGDFKAIDEPTWVWDHRTDRNHPALVMASDKGVYIRKARLTWIGGETPFQMTVTDPAGHERVLEGSFTEPPEQFQEAGSQAQTRFKMLLTEVGGDGKDRWQLVLNQQNNDRCLVELSRARGDGFVRFDTVGQQRQGTSFALSDTGYGEKKCIISGGLGTIQVSYQGKSYWVCCTGCEAAFNEDPAGWLAEAKKKDAAKESASR